MCIDTLKESSKTQCKQKAFTQPFGRAGFTLIELLVVIGIISLLMGILVPALRKARQSSRRIACRANLHSLALAFRMYLDDNSDVMPPASALPSEATKNRPAITFFLLPYLSEPKTFKCPGDTVKKYYISKGSSYEYNRRLGGKPVSKSRLAQEHGERQVDVMHDLDAFHGQRGNPNAFNYLYADGYVGDRRRE